MKPIPPNICFIKSGREKMPVIGSEVNDRVFVTGHVETIEIAPVLIYHEHNFIVCLGK